MKIEKLILKNFSAIKNAMDANEIILNLNECKNKICLLIGKNGSGKTTILSLLSPFADLGNLDVRNNQPLILNNKEGYKEIHISKDNSYYLIKHIYTPHKDKSHSVKSYIEKNGVELNVNGNVTSFKECVKEELQIEPDYLKLIRLGSNVTSMIGMTETERKNFMSKILEDIGIFLEYYKNVNNKLRQLKEMMSHTINKIDKLGISEKLTVEKEIQDIQENIDLLQSRYDELGKEIAILQHEINNIEDLPNLRGNLSNFSRKLEKMTRVMENKDKLESFDLSFYEKEITKIEDSIVNISTKCEVLDNKLKDNIVRRDRLENQIRTLDIQYEKERNSSEELLKMTNNLGKLQKDIDESKKIVGDFEPNFTLNELNSLISFLRSTQTSLIKTYEFGQEPIKKVVKLMKESNDDKYSNVEKYINDGLRKIDDTKNDIDSLLLARIYKSINFNDDIIFKCKNECEAKKLFNMIKDLYDIDTKKSSKKKLDADFYRDMGYVFKNILFTLNSFNDDILDIIDRLPDHIKSDFTIDNILSHMAKLETIYNEHQMNDLLSITTEYTNYQNNLKQYEIDRKNVDKFSAISNLDYLEEELSKAKSLYKEEEKSFKDDDEELHILKDKLKDLERALEVKLEIKETIEQYDKIRELVSKYQEEYDLYKKNNDKISNLNISLTGVTTQLDNNRRLLQTKISNLEQYKILTKEMNHFSKIYDEMELIKESLSSKEGMPLYYIMNYLGNIEDITNDLLDIVYNGDIYIDKFDITPSSFSIPFYNKGVRLPDVKYSSQGELSFLSIALSFALSSQALSKYNIMLLDEIDGPLDSKNREKFIKILENQIDRIDSEQNFLITHNAMFSSYPVDIIDLSFNNDKDEYPLANFISIERN